MLTDVVTAQMVSGVLNEIVGLLPVMIPAAISYIALRKGLGFVFSTLKKAKYFLFNSFTALCAGSDISLLHFLISARHLCRLEVLCHFLVRKF